MEHAPPRTAAEEVFSANLTCDSTSAALSNTSSNSSFSNSSVTTLPIDNQGHFAGIRYITVKSGKRLSTITTASGYTSLVFHANTVRQDLKSGVSYYPVTLEGQPKRLDYIDIQSSAGNGYTKQWVFNYDYWNDANCAANMEYAKRLRLLSVQEKAANVELDKTLKLCKAQATTATVSRNPVEWIR